MIQTTFRNYVISAEYLGNKAAGWDDAPEDNYNNHRVIVRNKTTAKRIQFEFWASLAEPELRKPSDLRNAFKCFLSDAISGEQSFEEFCGNFGYDPDSRKAEKTWKACVRAADKASRLLGDDDLYQIAEQLREADQ